MNLFNYSGLCKASSGSPDVQTRQQRTQYSPSSVKCIPQFLTVVVMESVFLIAVVVTTVATALRTTICSRFQLDC